MKLVEAAARALAETDRGCDDDWWHYLEDVRIVLNAIREPDEDMLIAAEQKCYLVSQDEIPNMHRAMIDVALAQLAEVDEANRPYRHL